MIVFGKGGTHTLPTGESVSAETILEWEVPFDFPAAWPAAARAPFEEFHHERQAMQARMDASIAAHAEPEMLYDQPEVSKDEAPHHGAVLGRGRAGADGLGARRNGDAAGSRRRDRPLGRVLAPAAVARRAAEDRHPRQGRRRCSSFAELETLPGTALPPLLSGTAGRHRRAGRGQLRARARGAGAAPGGARHERSGDLFPRPKFIVFCAFTFDPEAAKDIDETKGLVRCSRRR